MIELKAFSKLEKFQCLRNQLEDPGYGLKKPRMRQERPLKELEKSLQINARMYLKENHE